MNLLIKASRPGKLGKMEDFSISKCIQENFRIIHFSPVTGYEKAFISMCVYIIYMCFYVDFYYFQFSLSVLSNCDIFALTLFTCPYIVSIIYGVQRHIGISITKMCIHVNMIGFLFSVFFRDVVLLPCMRTNLIYMSL